MSERADADELALEALWRERFGEPPPIRGCAELALMLLCADPGGASSEPEAS